MLATLAAFENAIDGFEGATCTESARGGSVQHGVTEAREGGGHDELQHREAAASATVHPVPV